MSASSDDFFNNPLGSPPKQTANMNSTTRARKKKPAPPPPPRRTAGAAAGAGATTRATTATKRTTTGTTTSRPATTARTTNRRPLPTNRRPQSAAVTASSSSSTGDGGGGYYGNSTATTVNDTNSNNSAGFDWGATTSNAATTSTTANSWAAPAPAPDYSNWQVPTTTSQTAASNNEDEWFTNDASGATSAPAPSMMYSSTGFGAPAPAQGGGFQQQQQPGSQFMQGSMDSSAQAAPTPNVNVSQWSAPPPGAVGGDHSMNSMDNFENEPPLLEELGIFWDHIFLKTKAVVWPFKRFRGVSSNPDFEPLQQEQTDPNKPNASNDPHDVHRICQEADLIGPLVFGLLLGAELVLTGKLQFGYIYGFGLFGCLSMTLIVNLMAIEPVGIWTVTSVLGYALLPVNGLGLLMCLRLDYVLPSIVNGLLALLTVLWSTAASTRLLETGCGLREQRYLIAYPIALLYSAFVMMTLF